MPHTYQSAPMLGQPLRESSGPELLAGRALPASASAPAPPCPLRESPAVQEFNCHGGLGGLEPLGMSFSSVNAEIATIKFPLQPHLSVG